MKKNLAKRIMTFGAILFLAMLTPNCIKAQRKVADKELVGVWIMTSMKFDGEGMNYISDNYTQVKVYRADGEYACAEILKSNDGAYVIVPHEYGTYSFKNGKYIEMGHEIPSENMILTSKTTFKGRWKNRYDTWKKVTDMPEALTQHIVDKCKPSQASPQEMQKLMKKYIFAK